MKKHFLWLIVLLILFCFSCKQTPLTEEQKVNDFLYLYETMKANYPYLNALKVRKGVDWLGNKDKYLEDIRATYNDSTYIFTLNKIMEDLNDGHADLAPVSMWKSFVIYKEIAKEMPHYKPWAEAVDKVAPHIKYWAHFFGVNMTGSGGQSVDKQIKSNYKDTILINKKIALMQIPSIESSLIEIDRPNITRFLENLDGIKHLIIDIQGNGGGATSYWSELIVPRLIKDTIYFSHYYAIKGGALNRKFYARDFDTDTPVSKSCPFLDKIPAEFLNGSYYIVDVPDTIAPRNPVKFEGNIYLMVDGRVFSSAEGFAYFSQLTGWATLAGQGTHGDGVGSDPILIVLPESKIPVRIPVTAGFNANGSLNGVAGTTPELIIEGKNKEERLNKLIERLSNQ